MIDCWILTRSGKRVDLLEPTPDMIEVDDICSALANLCRFTGHCRRHYSVAEHSIIGASYLPKELQLEFLLHDAHEAYVGDLNKPLKLVCPEYQAIEQRIDEVIRQKFGLPPKMTPEVKRMDLVMLATEMRDLMPNYKEPIPCLEGIEPIADALLIHRKGESVNIEETLHQLIKERFLCDSQLAIYKALQKITFPMMPT